MPQSTNTSPEYSPELGFARKAKKRLTQAEFYTRVIKKPWDFIQIKRINKQITIQADRLQNKFFVVQVGANDGVHTDPIRKFILMYRWRGILVEPVPWHYKALKKTYKNSPQLKFIQAAITENEGKATLYATVQLANGQANPLHGKDSLQRELLEERAWMSSWPLTRLVRPIKVPTMRLQTLLKKENIKKIDMLVIDAEGYDKVVLDQLHLTGIAPTLILYEHLNMDRTERRIVNNRLKTSGYTLIKSRRDTLAIYTAASQGRIK